MAGTPRNIVVITIDALRADRSSLLGYQRPTTPTLDKLGKTGLLCRQTVCNAVFSQPSLTSLFTSSMPLSYGGYDSGAAARPPSLFRHFADNGFQVAQISTYPAISRYSGFAGDGIDGSALFALNTLPGLALTIMRETIRAYDEDSLSEAVMADKIRPVIEAFFDNIEDYCSERIRERTIDKTHFGNSRMVNDGFDFRRIQTLVAAHRKEYSNDPSAYINEHLVPFPGTNGWLAREWKYLRTPRAFVTESLFRASNKLLSIFSLRRAKLREYRFKRYLDADGLVDRTIYTLKALAKKQQPFFLWTHFFDTHVPYCPGKGCHWYNEAPRYLRALGYDPKMDLTIGINGKPGSEQDWAVWSALYDAAIAYTDERLARLFTYLESSGLMDNTLIVVSGDHGEELGEHGNISHHFLPYEHNTHVPMLFHGPGIKPSVIDGLTNLIDLGPSTAYFAGINPAAAWQGLPVTSAEIDARDHQVIECFHGGNCLFEARPLYIGIRTRRYKYFWKEYRDPTDAYSRDGDELYDLQNDPEETKNLYRKDHPNLPPLRRAIVARLREIPEIDDKRIARAFPEFVKST